MINLCNNTAGRINLTKTKDVILASLMVAALTLPLITQAAQQRKTEHPRYKLIDLGTFGGPSISLIDFSKIVNNQGTFVGGADTTRPDPFAPNCFSPSCFVQHAFQWQKGGLTDLGALPGGDSSLAACINEPGEVVGQSQTGLLDPLAGIPETVAVLWDRNGEIINLGTLGGNQGFATDINNQGQVVGAAANAIPDPFSLVGFATQGRAFLWENGVLRDLGTLGGPDSVAWYVNERGQVAGEWYTDSTPNDTTSIPTIHAFLWENGSMLDLGSLGGAVSGVYGLNNRGQVAGLMTLPGDESQHPFLWERGTLTDLGTFGGNNGQATGLNDAGEVVGVADFPGDLLHNAFLWKNGLMTDLGNLGQTSFAHGINSKGQVVGASRVSLETGEVRAFLWEDGGPMIDLNTLIPANSSLHLDYALSINDRGEIAGYGFLPNGDQHPFLLIPVGVK